jgi:tripartite-type tricarboxylate transporter receptor subunit TctC
MSFLKFFAGTLVATALVLPAAPALADSYPSKPITLTVGFAAGGNADTIARVIAKEMSLGLGKQVIVEPKPGAGGNVAAAAVAKAPPDGHTLLLVTGGHSVSGALYKTLPYKTVESFAPVSLITTFPFVLVTRSDSPQTTLAAVLAKAKAGNAVTYGSAGLGSTQHLTGELLGSMGQVNLTHVPYRGDAAALVGVLGGDVDFMVAGPTALMPHIKSGKLRPLAVSSAKRFSQLPDVPTVAELGIAGFDVQSWLGLAAPAGTPAPVIERLHAEVVRVLQLPSVRSTIEGLGSEVRSSTPDEMRTRIITETRQWTKVIEQARIERQ